MKASELIEQLQKLIDEHGDTDVLTFDENWEDEFLRDVGWSELGYIFVAALEDPDRE